MRYFFEDTSQPELRSGYPDITQVHLEQPEGRAEWRRRTGEFWRRQWSQPFALEPVVMRLVLEGEPPDPPDVTVELDFDPDWTAVHRLVREKGTWTPVPGEPDFVPRHDAVVGKPSARARRRANIERHRARIDDLVSRAAGLDEAFDDGGDLWRVVASEWQITAPRSRRGRKARLDPDLIDRLRSEGRTVAEVAEMLNAHPKSILNAQRRARDRRIS